jgi:hypothetical protein
LKHVTIPHNDAICYVPDYQFIPANSTAITMVLLLRYIIVIELACFTEVLAHANTTINTVLLNLKLSSKNQHRKIT